MTTSFTASQASTFTEARARAVMHNVLADCMLVADAGLIKRETIQKWFDELSYAVTNNAVTSFQLQLKTPEGKRLALNYEVRDDGTVQEGAKGGGFDPYGFPRDTGVTVCLTYRQGAPNLEKVQAWLRERGWGPGGSLVEGDSSRDRAFSKDGYGVMRSKVGDW
ncbi:hypothetical protein [Polyangium sorediatum]|uniref:Bacterial HORMA domain-containing protein n=1 Tax=Polyangium sorediatum TaxID=889274 RepID=A0ABT6P7I0_9BACT|nr:hypothetical protein [Polyangium sorediatum]MDI1436516.1 hypothetical protein [Polyangium sorediatum]